LNSLGVWYYYVDQRLQQFGDYCNEQISSSTALFDQTNPV